VPLAFETRLGGQSIAEAEVAPFFVFARLDPVVIGRRFVLAAFEGLEQKGAETDGLPSGRNRGSIGILFLTELAGKVVGPWGWRVIFLNEVELVAEAEAGGPFVLHRGEAVDGLGCS